jgi:hypothetical protein
MSISIIELLLSGVRQWTASEEALQASEEALQEDDMTILLARRV